MHEADNGRLLQRFMNFVGRIVVPIDVAADAGTLYELQVVFARKQADVIHLRRARREELDGAGDQIVGVAATERVVVGRINLVDVQIGGRVAAGPATTAAGFVVDRLDELVNVLVGQQAFELTLARDVEYADAVVRIQHRHTIPRGYGKPSFERIGVGLVQGVQDQRRQRKIVYTPNLGRDRNLRLVMRVNLDQRLDTERSRTFREGRNKIERFRQHETVGAAALDGITCRIEADFTYAHLGKFLENRLEVGSAGGCFDVDVELFCAERRPEVVAGSVIEPNRRKRRAGPGAVDQPDLIRYYVRRFAARENVAFAQEEVPVVRRATAAPDVLELRGVGRYVIHDQIGHHRVIGSQCSHVVPSAEPRVDASVIHRIETGIRTVDGVEKRQDVYAREQAAELMVEQGLDPGDIPAETICIGDQLHRVTHDNVPELAELCISPAAKTRTS